MGIWQTLALLMGLALPLSAAGQPVEKKNGIVDVPSKHSVDETVERLKNILQTKGITLFALIDHSGEAEKVGMKMRPTKLLIFGSPKAGNAAHAGSSKHCDRSAPQNSGLGRRQRQDLAFLQQP